MILASLIGYSLAYKAREEVGSAIAGV